MTRRQRAQMAAWSKFDTTLMKRSEPVERFATGSIRSADTAAWRYDLVSPFGLRRLAARYQLGARKYGDHNWQKGQPYSALLNHMIAHLVRFMEGDSADDNLAAVAWGAFALMEFEELGRTELDDRRVYKRRKRRSKCPTTRTSPAK